MGLEGNTELCKASGLSGNSKFLRSGMYLSLDYSGLSSPVEGRIKSVKGSGISFARAVNHTIPHIPVDTKVKLKIFIPGRGVMNYYGIVRELTSKECVISDISEWDGEERRGFYRQKLESSCYVRCISRNSVWGSRYTEGECAILDVSATGIRFSSSSLHLLKGDIVIVSDLRLMLFMPAQTVCCKVLRVVENGATKEYGCCFEGISEYEHGRLVDTIHQLKRLSEPKV